MACWGASGRKLGPLSWPRPGVIDRGCSVQISSQGKVIRVHVIRHGSSKEHSAMATP